MVIFDLICERHHEFEGWFKDNDELLEQQNSGMLRCPFCDSGNVIKKLAAPKLERKSNSLPAAAVRNSEQDLVVANQSPEKFAQLQEMLSKVHKYVDENFHDVGNRFADEAISIHRSEKQPENIKGTVNTEQMQALAEEGVAALPLPPRPIDKNKLN